MENQFILDFVKKKVQSQDLAFFQYAKRNKLQHLGGTEIDPAAFDGYLPDNIKGFTAMAMAMTLEPIKMAHTIAPGIKLTYELDTCAELDWIRNGRLIQIGFSYKGVNIKLYECAWGYAPNTNYENPSDLKQFNKALSMGNIHFGINAFVGINSLLEKIDWAEALDPEDDDFPHLQANNLIKHAPQEAMPAQVLDLFIQDNAERLHVSSVFARVMNFGQSNAVIDIQNKPIQEICFHVDYPLGKHFSVHPNVNRIKVSFQLDKNHRDFLQHNRDLLLRAKGLKLNSKLYQNMKNAQLQEFAQHFCIITYKDDNVSGAVLSNKMAHKLLVERIEEGSGKMNVGSDKISRKKFLENLNMTLLSTEQLNFWRDSVGKSVGDTSWYDPSLEGSLFNVREKQNETQTVSA